MPKKTEIINTFSGGIMNVGSGRDIKLEQSYEIVNMNPNSDSGAISLHGSGDKPLTFTNSAGTETDALIALATDTNFSIKPGYGLFKIDSDYSGLLDLRISEDDDEGTGDIDEDATSEAFSSATENATEYFFAVSKQHSTDGGSVYGMFINTLQNLLDGSNNASSDSNLNIAQFTSDSLDDATYVESHPSFFYARGGIRIVDGNDKRSNPGPYWYIRRVNTDFGLMREKYLNHPDYPWEDGDSPFVDHWICNNLRTTFTKAYDITPEDEANFEHNGFVQPKESFAHCIERSAITQTGYTGEMEDGTVMLMINNHPDNVANSQPYMDSMPADHQLRSCTGKDVIKFQLCISSTPDTVDAGAWNLDLNNDEFYVSYFYDNGMESRATRIRPWFAGWGNSEVAGIDTSYDSVAGNKQINNAPWFPQNFVDGSIDRSIDSIDPNDWLLLGGAFGQTGKASGLALKIQCMLGNETFSHYPHPDDAGFTPYQSGNGYPLGYDNSSTDITDMDTDQNSWNGELSSDGLIQGKGIKGIRLYLKSQSAYTTDSKYLLCELDFEQGLRSNGSPKYTPLNTRRTQGYAVSWLTGGTSVTPSANTNMITEYVPNLNSPGIESGHGDLEGRGSWMFAETEILPLPIPIETYKIINTIDYERLLIPSFKTATVLNSRAYIGNIRVRGISYPDRMMKSLPKKYDSYSDESWIDIETQDADEIIHLASFGQKVLQFKRNVLHIINVSEDKDTVESSYKFAGVTSSSQVCESDFGVIWANKNGLFFYNGTKLKNLLDDEGTVVLDKESWRDVISSNDGEQVVIGYHAPTKDIVIMRQGNDTNKQSSGFIYNLYKQNISKLEKRFSDSIKSNFVNTRDGELCYIDQTTLKLKKWDSTPTEEKLYPGTMLQTRDITFKNPSLRKTITSIYITYKSKNDSFVNIDAVIKKIDGTEETINHVGGTENYTLSDTSDKWKTVRISNYYDESSASSKSLRTKFKNVTSISLIFKRKFGTVPKEFMIDDISIVYRDKAVR